MNYPIFLISKSGKNPRREVALRRIVDLFGCQPIIVEGLDGSGDVDMSRLWPVHPEHEMSIPQICCTDAHLRAWVLFLRMSCAINGPPIGIFLEDDFKPVEGLTSDDVCRAISCARVAARQAVGWVTAMSVLHFGGRQYNPSLVAHPIEYQPGDLEYCVNGPIVRCRENGWNTAGYALSPAGASSMLAEATPMRYVIDLYTRFSRNGNLLYSTVTAMIEQDLAMRSFLGDCYWHELTGGPAPEGVDQEP